MPSYNLQQSYRTKRKKSPILKHNILLNQCNSRKKNSLLKYALCFHLCSADIQPLEGTVGSPQQESMCPPPHPFCLSLYHLSPVCSAFYPVFFLEDWDWRDFIEDMICCLHSLFQIYICLLQISHTFRSGVYNMALLTQMEFRFAWCSCPDTKRSVCSWPKRAPIYT